MGDWEVEQGQGDKEHNEKTKAEAESTEVFQALNNVKSGIAMTIVIKKKATL